MLKIKYFIRQSWLLIVLSFFFGLLIAIADAAWSPRIQQNKINKLNHLMGALLPEAKQFAPLEADIEIDIPRGRKEKVQIYKAISDANECVGWCFNAAGDGFSGKIELVVAADRLLEKIAGFDVLTSSETPGFGDKIKTAYFRDQFAGAQAGSLNLAKTGNVATIDSEIVAITGATVSSRAVVNILNNYLSKIKDQMAQKELITNGR